MFFLKPNLAVVRTLKKEKRTLSEKNTLQSKKKNSNPLHQNKAFTPTLISAIFLGASGACTIFAEHSVCRLGSGELEHQGPIELLVEGRELLAPRPRRLYYWATTTATGTERCWLGGCIN